MDKFTWSIRVPIFKNRIIVNQLALAIGIPFGILCLVLLVIEAYYGLAMVGGALVLAFVLVLLIFRGTYDVLFSLDEEGITCENQNKQKKRVGQMAAVTTLLGLVAKNPTTVGTGMMAGVRIKERLLWKKVKKVKYLDRQRTIMLRAGWGESIAVFCREENYKEISLFIRQKTGI
ncbi:MAG TPA: hypothetical protein VFD08_05200 [Clostridia bacterium]|nr:hypothetical protein [Clostridia bacterium]